jgi:hypothetical protein
MLLFSDDKISPLMLEDRIGAGEGCRRIKAIVVYLVVEGFKGFAEHRPGVEVDALIGELEAEAVAPEELLRT